MKKPKRIHFHHTAAFWLRRFKQLESQFFGDWKEYQLLK